MDGNLRRRRQAEHGCRLSSASTTTRKRAAWLAARSMSAQLNSIRRPGQLALTCPAFSDQSKVSRSMLASEIS
jgi:hypothetical protein